MPSATLAHTRYKYAAMKEEMKQFYPIHRNPPQTGTLSYLKIGQSEAVAWRSGLYEEDRPTHPMRVVELRSQFVSDRIRGRSPGCRARELSLSLKGSGSRTRIKEIPASSLKARASIATSRQLGLCGGLEEQLGKHR
jgi:hypothetical protein